MPTPQTNPFISQPTENNTIYIYEIQCIDLYEYEWRVKELTTTEQKIIEKLNEVIEMVNSINKLLEKRYVKYEG